MHVFRSLVFALLLSSGLRTLAQQTPEPAVVLPPFVLVEPRVANEAPVGTYPMPVTGLRFEPQVDVQARNFAEGQADVSVRGGIFENTGFRVGNSNIVDPQTGHYAAELPVPTAMLGGPRVSTGAEAALAGLNATVGTIGYQWGSIRKRQKIGVAAGPHGLWRGSVYAAREIPTAGAGGKLATDLEFARSESEGPIPGGDHRFSRIAGRVQWTGRNSQTDCFAGYQSKFLGWPNLYTPFGWSETDSLQTTLFSVNHRWVGAADDWWQASAVWRRNVDDYEADRTRPGVFNPYQHETRFIAVAVEGRKPFGQAAAVHFRSELAGDEIESTSLAFGRFRSRTYAKAGLELERVWQLRSPGTVATRGGAVWAYDNRGSSVLSPLAEIAWQPVGERRPERVFLQVSGASQVPGYTALSSNPAAGLFRGNPNLPRERCTNWEIGATTSRDGLQLHGAVFLRQQRGLTDWTYRRGVTARSANPVDIETMGFESVATYQWPRGRIVGSYAWLEKREDYRGAVVDASFYALNFPRHRATLAFVWRFTGGFEFRLDNEYRVQQANFLRQGPDDAFLTAATLNWSVAGLKGLEVSAQLENLWKSSFQEVPAVPATPRQYSLGMSYRW